MKLASAIASHRTTTRWHHPNYTTSAYRWAQVYPTFGNRSACVNPWHRSRGSVREAPSAVSEPALTGEAAPPPLPPWEPPLLVRLASQYTPRFGGAPGLGRSCRNSDPRTKRVHKLPGATWVPVSRGEKPRPLAYGFANPTALGSDGVWRCMACISSCVHLSIYQYQLTYASVYPLVRSSLLCIV